MNKRQFLFVIGSMVAAAGIASLFPRPLTAQGQPRDVAVRGDKFAFSPATIEVQRDEIVKVTFTASDMAHSFTIDSYRIAKRASAGQSVTFEFRADQPGRHEFYCNLTHDERCRNMKGMLVVR
jgi:heme/copper-type cytochrome/quinol oxidase subunit 2